ncbi:hypothetical protein [Ancylobacter pratisalsi]|uniref:Uncharacterized protein n=1 Tax=Ancylobacter pratisalsi TaxID=1745854 RepID=A0A6P1YQZ7_9HYPH|nr:hypothetical protein [Ancylobacter pratisalsi]QIB35917.1 hypothetical protein G3A50_21035 [Ancylobacter pratisalsi]
MKTLEERARALCAIDLQRRGIFGAELAARVDQFWPVLAAEIYPMHETVGEWPFTVTEIERLSEEYRRIIDPR